MSLLKCFIGEYEEDMIFLATFVLIYFPMLSLVRYPSTVQFRYVFSKVLHEGRQPHGNLEPRKPDCVCYIDVGWLR